MAPNRLFPGGTGVSERPACSAGENPILVNLLALLASRFPRAGDGPERGAVDTRKRGGPSPVSVSGDSRELTRLSCSPKVVSGPGVLERLEVARGYSGLESSSFFVFGRVAGCGGAVKGSHSSGESVSRLMNILPETGVPNPDAERDGW